MRPRCCPGPAPWKDTKKAARCEVQPPQGSRLMIGVKQRDHQVVDRVSVQEYVGKMCTGCCMEPSATGWAKKGNGGGSVLLEISSGMSFHFLTRSQDAKTPSLGSHSSLASLGLLKILFFGAYMSCPQSTNIVFLRDHSCSLLPYTLTSSSPDSKLYIIVFSNICMNTLNILSLIHLERC